MIRPPWDGVAFSERSDGDLRRDVSARDAVSASLGLSGGWAELAQVHGSRVIRVDAPGQAGEADAMWTTRAGLPLAVFTADCLGLALTASDAVGVAHAGWRGAAAGVVGELREAMESSGHEVTRVAIGAGIGPCCFEVGPEVAERFPDHRSMTTWDTTSVDLESAVLANLAGLEVWSAGGCTMHEERWFSHRADGTQSRLATIGWVP